MKKKAEQKKKRINAENTEKLATFAEYMMAHPMLLNAFERIMYEVDSPATDPLIFVVGPTGVGKSTLDKKLYKTILEDKTEAMNADQHYLPVARMEVIAYDGGQFRWKDFYQRYLNALMEPLIDKKIKTSSLALGDINDGDLNKSQIAFAPGLRRAVEKALLRRKVEVFLLDEAQHLGKVRSGRRLLDQLDCIKSLANTSGVKHVLFGTYQLLSLWNLSGQLARRSKVIHLPRYRLDKDDEVEMFQSIIATFEEHLPLEEKAGLVDNWEDIYVRCAGCVGILKTWMHNALSIALQRGLPAVEYKLMEQHSLSSKQLQKIAEEINFGERKLLDSAAGYQKAKTLLLRDPAKPVAEESSKLASAPKPKRAKKRVGERLPGRDKVGRKQKNKIDDSADAA